VVLCAVLRERCAVGWQAHSAAAAAAAHAWMHLFVSATIASAAAKQLWLHRH